MKMTHEQVQQVLNDKVKELKTKDYIIERDWKQLQRDALALRENLRKLRQ